MKKSKIYGNMLLPTQKSHQNWGSTVFDAGTFASKLSEKRDIQVSSKCSNFFLILPSKGIELLF